jgi:hypothetical protein
MTGDGRMKRRALAAGCLAALALACHARPVPLSVQAGATFVIPLTESETPGLFGLAQVGFGGTEHADPQRGSLVVRLGSATGYALTTRLAFLGAAPVESLLGPGGSGFGRSLLLVVDVPSGAPLGVHDLVLVNERVRDGVPQSTVVTPAPLSLAILPATVVAGGQSLVGAPTPAGFFTPAGLVPFDVQGSSTLPEAVPPPSFGVKVTTANGQVPAGGAGRFVAYAKVDLAYPRDTIDVVRVVAADPARQLVWWEDDRVGGLRVYVLTQAPVIPTGVGALRVVFDLDDPADTLDLSEIAVTGFEARDQTGSTTIKSQWALAATKSAIR